MYMSPGRGAPGRAPLEGRAWCSRKLRKPDGKRPRGGREQSVGQLAGRIALRSSTVPSAAKNYSHPMQTMQIKYTHKYIRLVVKSASN